MAEKFEKEITIVLVKNFGQDFEILTINTSRDHADSKHYASRAQVIFFSYFHSSHTFRNETIRLPVILSVILSGMNRFGFQPQNTPKKTPIDSHFSYIDIREYSQNQASSSTFHTYMRCVTAVEECVGVR